MAEGRAIVATHREAILRPYESLHIEHQWISSIGQTSSDLFDPDPRDLDVVLLVTDLQPWLDLWYTLDLPTEIEGKRIDRFAKLVPVDGDYAVLDLYSARLWLPAGYKVRSNDPRITVLLPQRVLPTVKSLFAPKPGCKACQRGRLKV